MKYRKKPVVIEAIKWTGSNQDEIDSFMSSGIDPSMLALGSKYHFSGDQIMIYTLEGNHLASIDDFIIRGVAGEYYPCKPNIFKATYDKESP